jgi:hypothetical protein
MSRKLMLPFSAHHQTLEAWRFVFDGLELLSRSDHVAFLVGRRGGGPLGAIEMLVKELLIWM